MLSTTLLPSGERSLIHDESNKFERPFTYVQVKNAVQPIVIRNPSVLEVTNFQHFQWNYERSEATFFVRKVEKINFEV